LLKKYAEIHGVTGSFIEQVDGLITHLIERHREIIQQKSLLVPIMGSGLSRRTAKILAGRGVGNIRQLADLTRVELRRIPGIGSESVREVRATLADFGLKLQETPT